QASGKTGAVQEVGFSPVAGQPNHWTLQLALKLHSADPNNPFFYDVEIQAVGVVELCGDVPAEKRELIAAVNGLGILYGACREMVMNITARSIYGPCCLPSLSFGKVLQEAKEDQIAEQKSSAAAKA